jgi:hypothetical protein
MDLKLIGGLIILGIEGFITIAPFIALLALLGWFATKEEEKMADRIADRIKARL